MFYSLLLALLLLLNIFIAPVSAQRKSNHASRRVDDALKGLNEGTRKRVLAMQNAGMPHKAIADKIKYEVGSENIARRMMEKIETQEDKARWAHQQKQKFVGRDSVNKQKITNSKRKSRVRAREEL